jgi:adenylate cyclase
LISIGSPALPYTGGGRARIEAEAKTAVAQVDTSEANRRLAGILAADVVGFSAMVGTDEPATLARVRTLRTDIIEPLAARYGGRLFKSTGDGFLVAFASAVQALRCAIAIQERLRSEPDGLRLRIGVHQGEVVAEGDDLLGDGVIIAARLEPLAEPGGICISARVREDAAGKMALEVDDLGTPELKNIAAKIQVFRVGLVTAERPALPLPDKPSLVVLPFQNMSGDPEQEYFADGMVEEITTALSRIRSLFVIARNSAFTYKGRAVDVRQVGRELGVRYVLEGSVRKAGSRVRITGQLVEAATGTHLWADRFDGTLEDVFDLQDRMTANVVAAIEPNVRAAEIRRAQRKPAENLQAYDLVLRALPPFYSRTQAGLAKAAQLLQQAVAIEPRYAPSLAYLALCHFITVTQGWIDRGNPAVADAMLLVQSALALDSNDPEVLEIAGNITATLGGDLSGGVALVNRSLELNPNNAVALAGAAALQAFAGDTAAAISLLDRSVRHNPLDRNYRLCMGYVLAYFVAGEYERVVEWTEMALQEVPHSATPLRYRAASFGQLGRLEEGRQVVQRLLALVPNFTITHARQFYEFDVNNIIKKPGVADALYEGLRRCGVPE